MQKSPIPFNFSRFHSSTSGKRASESSVGFFTFYKASVQHLYSTLCPKHTTNNKNWHDRNSLIFHTHNPISQIPGVLLKTHNKKYLLDYF